MNVSQARAAHCANSTQELSEICSCSELINNKMDEICLETQCVSEYRYSPPKLDLPCKRI